MYIVKIVKRDKEKNQELDIMYFHHIENVLAAIADKTIFRKEHISEKIIMECSKENPSIFYGGVSSSKADDFEFRYTNGIYIYVGEPLFFDDEMPF